MSLKSFLYVLAIATVSQAATPEDFEPASETDLLVSFAAGTAENGNTLLRDATQAAPVIGTESKLEGTSFAVMMIDLDIPTDNPPETGTLLHWMQTGLTQSESSTSINTTSGAMTAFVLQAPETEAALAAYIGPNPPARVPLAHRYTEILVDTTDATEANLAALEAAAANRLGFDTLAVLTEGGLADKVVAGNFFVVQNPGPAIGRVSNSTTTGASAPTGSLIAPTAAPTAPAETPVQSPIQPASAVGRQMNGFLVGLLSVGAVFVVL